MPRYKLCDNNKDFAYLISDEGKRNLIDVIVVGLEAFYSLSFPFHEHKNSDSNTD